MVLHDREYDLVACLDALAAEGVGNQVDPLGGVAREDDLLGTRGIEEGPHLLARVFVGLGRLVGEEMQASMHVGVLLGRRLAHAIEHHLWLLCRGPVVEIDQRLAIDLHIQRREIGTDPADVVGAVAYRRMRHGPFPSHSSAATMMASRKASCATSSTTSPIKARINSASASFSGMPRDIR